MVLLILSYGYFDSNLSCHPVALLSDTAVVWITIIVILPLLQARFLATTWPVNIAGVPSSARATNRSVA